MRRTNLGGAALNNEVGRCGWRMTTVLGASASRAGRAEAATHSAGCRARRGANELWLLRGRCPWRGGGGGIFGWRRHLDGLADVALEDHGEEDDEHGGRDADTGRVGD